MWTQKIPIDTLRASETKYGRVRGIVERSKVWEESQISDKPFSCVKMHTFRQREFRTIFMCLKVRRRVLRYIKNKIDILKYTN